MRMPQPVGPAYGAGYLPFYVIPMESDGPTPVLTQTPTQQTLFGPNLLPSFIRSFSALPSVCLFVAHCLYNCARSRQRDEAASKHTSTTHPLCSCVCDLLVNLAGGICVSLFTATPVPAFQAPFVALTAVLCWYAVNHSPYDAVWRLWDYTLVKIVLCVLCEHRRVQCMAAGMVRARETYTAQDAWPAAVAGGFMHSMGPVAMEWLLLHCQARDITYTTDYTPDRQIRLLSLQAFVLVFSSHDAPVRLADPPTLTAVFTLLAAENAVLGILGERFPRLRQALNTPIHFNSQAQPLRHQSPQPNSEQQQQQPQLPSLSPDMNTTRTQQEQEEQHQQQHQEQQTQHQPPPPQHEQQSTGPQHKEEEEQPPPPPPQQQQQQQRQTLPPLQNRPDQVKEIQHRQTKMAQEDEAEKVLIRSMIFTGCFSFLLSAYLLYTFLLSADLEDWWE